MKKDKVIMMFLIAFIFLALAMFPHLDKIPDLLRSKNMVAEEYPKRIECKVSRKSIYNDFKKTYDQTSSFEFNNEGKLLNTILTRSYIKAPDLNEMNEFKEERLKDNIEGRVVTMECDETTLKCIENTKIDLNIVDLNRLTPGYPTDYKRAKIYISELECKEFK